MAHRIDVERHTRDGAPRRAPHVRGEGGLAARGAGRNPAPVLEREARALPGARRRDELLALAPRRGLALPVLLRG